MGRVSVLNLAMVSSAAAGSLYDLHATDIDGHKISLDFKGNVTVVVNTATY
jgi:glutathione peroxidase-family protein